MQETIAVFSWLQHRTAPRDVGGMSLKNYPAKKGVPRWQRSSVVDEGDWFDVQL
jgi:hypothetical protein